VAAKILLMAAKQTILPNLEPLLTYYSLQIKLVMAVRNLVKAAEINSMLYQLPRHLPLLLFPLYVSTFYKPKF